MNNIGNVLLSTHAFFVAAITLTFFMVLLCTDDELEQYHLFKSLKTSIILTILLLIGYGYYMLLIGNKNVSVHMLFFSIETLSILTLFISQFRTLKEKITRQEYKTTEKKINKLSKIVYLMLGIFNFSLIIYIIYKIILRSYQ